MVGIRTQPPGASTQPLKANTLSRPRTLHEAAARLGIECPADIKWLGWKVGSEYSRSLSVRNLSADLLQISWKLPASKLFVLEYPEPISLSPGMCFTFKVAFCPTRQEPFEDQIEFMCSHGSFSVPLKACLPAAKIQVPEALEFGFTPVKHNSQSTIQVENTGDAAVQCKWQIGHPFSILPESASIEAGQAVAFDVTFCPQEASVYTVLAACHAETGFTATVKISGIGKYPFLALDRSQLRFGKVLVGEQVEQVLQLTNQGQVPAEFTVVQAVSGLDSLTDTSIKVLPARGHLQPTSSIALRVSYTPVTSNTFACQHFTVQTAGGRQVPFSVSGTAVAPTVQLSTNCLAFGSIPANQTAVKVVQIFNRSELPAYYEFVSDQMGVFGFDRVRGSIAANSAASVTVTFQPVEASNYYKRVSCLIKDGSVLTIDLLGTCFTDQLRPPSLTPADVTRYLEQSSDQQGSGSSSSNAVSGGNVEGPAAWEGFFGRQDPQCPVSISSTQLNFGSCARLSPANHQTLTVTNTSASARVTVFLSVPSWQGPGLQSPSQQVFQVFPEQLEIRANSSATFRVAFRPSLDGQYYSQSLDVIACLKTQCSFRGLADGKPVLPPWTLPVQVTGNTFLHQQEQPDTKAQLSSTVVALAPALPDQATYQTVMVMNHGDTALQFELQGLGQHPHLTCKPDRGALGPQSWQMLALRCQAAAAGTQIARLSCVINSNQAAAQPLLVQAPVSTPSLSMQPAGSLFFKPTCIGASSQRDISLHNTSRVPLAYQWSVPSDMQGSFAAQPMSGILQGNEKHNISWLFAPSDKTTYNFTAACTYGSIPANLAMQIAQGQSLGSPMESQHALPPADINVALAKVFSGNNLTESLPVNLVGQGTVGALTLQPTSIDFGTVTVGYPVKRSITLLNQSGGNLRYSISCRQAAASETPATAAQSSADVRTEIKPEHEASDESQHADDGAAQHLVIDEFQGMLVARATKTLTLTLTPQYRKRYSLQLVCETATATALDSKEQAPAVATAEVPASLCAPPVIASVQGFSTYPTLMITDVVSQGWEKPFAWRQTSCSQINLDLADELSQAELELAKAKVQGRWTTQRALGLLQPLPMDFGVGGVDAAPTCVVLQLTNPGDLAVEWEVQKVGDVGRGVEMENWVEPSRPRDDNEKLHDLIIRERLLQMQPSEGCLQPGQSTTCVLTYRHQILGQHDLALLLVIKDGKQLHLHLKGSTMPATHMCLADKSPTFHLAPVPIGDALPPRQMYCLSNGGPAELTYSIDASPLTRLTAENYGFEVLRLVDGQQGTVAPGQSAGLNFLFSPVEAKEYSISLPIKLGNGTKDALTVSGKGFHPLPAVAQSALTDSPATTASSIAGSAGQGTDIVLRTLWQSQAEHGADKATWPGFSPASSQQAQQQQLLVLSHGVVSFGPVSIKRCSKRVVALTAGPQHGVEFEWDLGMLSTNGRLDGQLEVQPASGKLAPGQCCLCKLTFTAGLNPQLFEGAIHCRAVPLPPSEAPEPAAAAAATVHSAGMALPSQSAGTQPQDLFNAGRAAKRQTSNLAQSMPRMTGSIQRSPRVSSSLGAAPKAALRTSAKQGSPRKPGAGKQSQQGDVSNRRNSIGSPSKSNAPASPMSSGQRQALGSDQRRLSVSSTNMGSYSGSPAGASRQNAAGPAHGGKSPSKGSSNAMNSGNTVSTNARSKQSPGRISSITNLPARNTSRSPQKAKHDPGRKPVVEVVEEVIAEHPPPPSNTFQAGSLLASRAPVHAALTAATIGRFPSMQATHQLQAQAASADHDHETLPQPQVLALYVEGRVLTSDQFRAGDYVLPSELPLAHMLLEQGDWAPSPSQSSDAQQLPEAQDVHQATTVLEELLAEVINGTDVAMAMADLFEEETPTWAELQHGTRLAQTAISQPKSRMAEVHSSSSGEDPGTAEGAAPERASSGSEDARLVTERATDATSTKEHQDQGSADRVLQDAEFQEIAEYVLESACFSLLQESAAGRWQSPAPS